MGGRETKSGKNPEQPQQEKFGLVGTDRLIGVIRNSTFLLEPQKVSLERLIRSIQLDPVPADVVPSVINQRAKERDAAVTENHHLWEENRNLRDENNRLKREVDGISKELSQIRGPLQKKTEEEEEISDGAIYERRILERVTNAYEGFVRDLGLALEDIVCKNKDFDGLDLLYLVFERLLGIDIGQLSPLEQREIDWTAKDLGYDEDHEVDTSVIDDLIVDLKTALEIAQKAPLKDDWSPLPVESKQTEEDAT